MLSQELTIDQTWDSNFASIPALNWYNSIAWWVYQSAWSQNRRLDLVACCARTSWNNRLCFLLEHNSLSFYGKLWSQHCRIGYFPHIVDSDSNRWYWPLWDCLVLLPEWCYEYNNSEAGRSIQRYKTISAMSCKYFERSLLTWSCLMCLACSKPYYIFYLSGCLNIMKCWIGAWPDDMLVISLYNEITASKGSIGFW